MVSGAYSSIFIATPLLAQLKEREPDMKKLASRVATRRAKDSQKARSGATATPALVHAGSGARSADRHDPDPDALEPEISDGVEPSNEDLAAAAAEPATPTSG